MADDIKSPCISVCFLDQNDVCEGCFRTMDEITNWSIYDNCQKAEVVRAACKRRQESGLSL